MQEILQYIFSGVTTGAIYAVIAVGFSMLYNATDLINFAHGEFVMLGALILATLWGGFCLPLPAAVILSVGVTAAAGFLFERLAVRPVKKPDPIVLVIITVGASIFFRGLGMLIWGKDAHSIKPFMDTAPLDILGAKLLPQSITIVLVCILLVVGLYQFYNKTLTGKAMQATAISKKAARLTGIPTEKMMMLAFILSTGMGAVAGIIIAPITMSSYDMGTMLGIKGFCAAMLGGLGSLWGALLGGIILGVLEALSVGFFFSGVKDAVAFFLLLIILYVKPEGLLGAAKIKRF